ncbi:hypothetical protein LWI29_015639 [Acer saccharum]|uniref:Uncharacterized protein n=1 Tax=Acer saccharum TaxID=4024 RepID=A0AA39SDE6_ACESA|nr:hypothetical protein LWI29_015639 [Acer saccharum]
MACNCPSSALSGTSQSRSLPASPTRIPRRTASDDGDPEIAIGQFWAGFTGGDFEELVTCEWNWKRDVEVGGFRSGQAESGKGFESNGSHHCCFGGELTCSPLCGGFTYFALAVLRCSVSETLRILHWLCFGAPYRRLYVFCTGCASVLRIRDFTCAPLCGGFSAPVGDFLVLPRALARSRFFCFRLRSFVFGDTFRDRAPLNLRFYSLRWRVVHQEVS